MSTQWLEIKARGCCRHVFLVIIIPEPTARSAVPGVSPGRGLLIPHGYLHPDKSEHSEVHEKSINDRRRVSMVRRAWVVISLIS